MNKRVIFILCVIFLVILGIGLFYSFDTRDETGISTVDEKEIKSVVEIFVKEDFYFDGGKNIFSKVDNDDLKRYLEARNNYKRSNNEKDTFRVIDGTRKYKFKYDSISISSGNVRVDVNVQETNDYKMIEDDGLEHITKGASTINNYTIYLKKNNSDKWMVKSANINVDVDLIDADYNVNYLLGFEKKYGDTNSKNKSSDSYRVKDIDTSVKEIKNKEKILLKSALNDSVK